MVTVDSFRRANPQIHLLAAVIYTGLAILLAGLWWLQVVKRKDFQVSVDTQSYRTMRIPAIRGRIMDRDRNLLADTRPSYNLNLYLEEIRPRFHQTYTNLKPAVLESLAAQREGYAAKVNRELTPTEKRRFQLRGNVKVELEKSARYLATSNLVAEIAVALDTPLNLDPKRFHRHYGSKKRAFPLTSPNSPSHGGGRISWSPTRNAGRF